MRKSLLSSSQNSAPRAESLTSYGNADIVRGGLLYDKWYKVPDVKNNQVPESKHTLYPETAAQTQKTDGTTWRCKNVMVGIIQGSKEHTQKVLTSRESSEL